MKWTPKSGQRPGLFLYCNCFQLFFDEAQVPHHCSACLLGAVFPQSIQDVPVGGPGVFPNIRVLTSTATAVKVQLCN